MPIREIVGVLIVVAIIINYARSVAHRTRQEWPEMTGAKFDMIAGLMLLIIVVSV